MNGFLGMMINIPSFDQIKKMPFTYYKREGNIFYFKNEWFSFDIEMKGKDMFDFTDQFKIGDKVRFFEDGSQGHDLSTMRL